LKRRYVKYSTVVLSFLTLFILGWILVFQESTAIARARYDQMSGLERLRFYNESLEEQNEKLKTNLRITVPKGVAEKDIVMETDYVNQRFVVSIPRANEKFLFKNPIVGSSNNIQDIITEAGGDVLNIEILLDAVYEPKVSYEGDYMYVGFKDPHELYDKIVVIDAGHGGNDPGTIAEGFYEADIDLEIAKKLKPKLEAQGIRVYMTRETDKYVGLQTRVGMANAVKADAFISIHCNSTSARSSKYNGTQVLFNDGDETGNSYELAELCMEGVTTNFSSERMMVSSGSSIYIVRNSKVPVALVEVGFMSNKEELAKLIDEDYQNKAADGITEAISKAYLRGIIHG